MLAGGQRQAGVRTRPHTSPDTHTRICGFGFPRGVCAQYVEAQKPGRAQAAHPGARRPPPARPSGGQRPSHSASWLCPGLRGLSGAHTLGRTQVPRLSSSKAAPTPRIVLIWAPGAPHVPMKFPSDHLEGRGPVLKHLNFF